MFIIVVIFFLQEMILGMGLELKEIQKERRCIQINYVTFNTDWPVENSD